MAVWQQMVEIVRAGGWVMIPLLAMSVVSVALILERVLFWLRAGRGEADLLGAVAERVRRGDFSGAGAVARGGQSAGARFAAEVIRRSQSDLDAGVAPGEAIAIEAAEQFRPAVERFGAVLAAVVAGAPLLGILGTVTGIIQSFDLLGAADIVDDPVAVAGGIAEALYTTAFGLIIALVTLFPLTVFRAAADRCLGRFEALGAAIAEGGPRALTRAQ